MLFVVPLAPSGCMRAPIYVLLAAAAVRARVCARPQERIAELKSKLTGVPAEGTRLGLRMVSAHELWSASVSMSMSILWGAVFGLSRSSVSYRDRDRQDGLGPRALVRIYPSIHPSIYLSIYTSSGPYLYSCRRLVYPFCTSVPLSSRACLSLFLYIPVYVGCMVSACFAE
jgi:hypothetical protein